MRARTVIRRKAGEVRREAAGDFPFSEADVRGLSQSLGEPSWLSQRRAQAWAAHLATPMPSLADEAWRRTDIRNLPAARAQQRPADDLPVDPELLQPLLGKSQSALLVVQPGREAVREVDPAVEGQGVVFADWATAVRRHPDILERYLDRVVGPGEGKFAALAAAVANQGVLVYVPRGVELAVPLHSVLWAPGVDAGFFSRLLIVLEDGAALRYLHETASPTEPEGQAVHAGIVEIHVGENSRLTFVELQNWGEHVWNFTHERAQVHRDGQIDWIFGAVGSPLTKNFTELDLVGQGAVGRMSGFYFTDGVQHLDHDTQQNHRAPNTTSDLLFKGALVGRSRSVWQGMIYVAPGAQKTDGYQANRNLILSKHARADSIPGLEILADDVRCTHGATVGQLEQEPVFYLMSRGLPRREAERVLVDGFFDPIMQRIPFEGVRERLQRAIDQKLS
jgi:Fe-S cluster assembly protein SufD